MGRLIHYIIVDEFGQTVSDPQWPALTGDEVVWLPATTTLVIELAFHGQSPIGKGELKGKAGEVLRASITVAPPTRKRFKYTLSVTGGAEIGVNAAESEPEIIVDGGGNVPGPKKARRTRKKAR